MTFAGGRVREVKPLSFIYEVAQALPADVCLEAIRRFEARADQHAANRFKDIGYNLQRTLPGEYYHWHVDAGPGAFSEPHVHRGVTLEKGVKYIATTWICFA